jgi:hypothetical protein
LIHIDPGEYIEHPIAEGLGIVECLSPIFIFVKKCGKLVWRFCGQRKEARIQRNGIDNGGSRFRPFVGYLRKSINRR